MLASRLVYLFALKLLVMEGPFLPSDFGSHGNNNSDDDDNQNNPKYTLDNLITSSRPKKKIVSKTKVDYELSEEGYPGKDFLNSTNNNDSLLVISSDPKAHKSGLTSNALGKKKSVKSHIDLELMSGQYVNTDERPYLEYTFGTASIIPSNFPNKYSGKKSSDQKLCNGLLRKKIYLFLIGKQPIDFMELKDKAKSKTSLRFEKSSALVMICEGCTDYIVPVDIVHPAGFDIAETLNTMLSAKYDVQIDQININGIAGLTVEGMGELMISKLSGSENVDTEKHINCATATAGMDSKELNGIIQSLLERRFCDVPSGKHFSMREASSTSKSLAVVGQGAVMAFIDDVEDSGSDSTVSIHLPSEGSTSIAKLDAVDSLESLDGDRVSQPSRQLLMQSEELPEEVVREDHHKVCIVDYEHVMKQSEAEEGEGSEDKHAQSSFITTDSCESSIIEDSGDAVETSSPSTTRSRLGFVQKLKGMVDGSQNGCDGNNKETQRFHRLNRSLLAENNIVSAENERLNDFQNTTTQSMQVKISRLRRELQRSRAAAALYEAENFSNGTMGVDSRADEASGIVPREVLVTPSAPPLELRALTPSRPVRSKKQKKMA